MKSIDIQTAINTFVWILHSEISKRGSMNPNLDAAIRAAVHVYLNEALRYRVVRYYVTGKKRTMARHLMLEDALRRMAANDTDEWYELAEPEKLTPRSLYANS